MSDDPYVYPGSDVLINKHDIKDKEKLAKTENLLSGIRISELQKNPIKGNFDFEHLKKTHEHIFKDTYQWAGKVRTVNIAKGGDMFAFPNYIEKEGSKTLTSLANENRLKGRDKPEFVGRLAHYLGEINAVHPFREGNGRTQQTFFAQVAKEAGYSIDFSKTTKDEVNKAFAASFQGDSKPLTTLLTKITTPALDKQIEQLHKQVAKIDNGVKRLTDKDFMPKTIKERNALEKQLGKDFKEFKQLHKNVMKSISPREIPQLQAMKKAVSKSMGKASSLGL